MFSRILRLRPKAFAQRLCVPLAACLGLGFGLSACTPQSPPPLRVEVFGDSLAYQAAPYISYFFGATGRVTTKESVFAATAICNWIPTIGHEVDPHNPAGFHPNAIIMIFSGVAIYPCMKDANGVAPTGQALIDRYESDARIVIMYAYRAHIPVYFVSTPIEAKDASTQVGDTPLGQMFSLLPNQFPGGRVRFIDAGQAVEWQGHYTVTMPCAPFEHCSGHWPDGTPTVVVRNSDGVHFCPVQEIFFDCPTSMPGAMRFAAAITKPVLTDFRVH